jgi:4,5-dihydroxyphthalate decarboxylase
VRQHPQSGPTRKSAIETSSPAAVRLRTLLGDYPVTRALKQGEVRSPHVALEFADVKVPNTAFKRVVRELAFDVAELAIVTFLMAKAYGKPLVLLPTVVMGRFQHPYIVYDAERGPLAPRDLAGRRVGIRSYSVTTATWIRGILADDYGVDLDRVQWVTFEDAHVAEFRDPPAAERAAAGKDLVRMLLEGEIDAAIVGAVPSDPRLKPLIPDPLAAAEAWRRKNGALQINHMVVVKESLSKSNPRAVQEVYRLFLAAKQAAGLPAKGELDANPFGVEANRRNLEVAGRGSSRGGSESTSSSTT